MSKSFSLKKYNFFFFSISFRVVHVPCVDASRFRRFVATFFESEFSFFSLTAVFYVTVAYVFWFLHLTGLTRNTFVAISITPTGRPTSNTTTVKRKPFRFRSNPTQFSCGPYPAGSERSRVDRSCSIGRTKYIGLRLILTRRSVTPVVYTLKIPQSRYLNAFG